MGPRDLAREPHSVRGSWLSLAWSEPPEDLHGGDRAHGLTIVPAGLGPGLYLRNHHARGVALRDILRIRPVIHGTPRDPEPEWLSTDGTAVELHDSHTGAHLELVLDSESRVLIASAGCGIELAAVVGLHAGVYGVPPSGSQLVFNLRPALRSYRLSCRGGDMHLAQQIETSDTANSARSLAITTDPGAELLIEEFWSAPESSPPTERIRDVRARVERDRDRFQAGFARVRAAAPAALRSGVDAAAWTLWSRTMAPCGNLRRESVFMALGNMDQVWSWDNLFNMAALAQVEPELAMDQLRVVADHQNAAGAYPDGLNDLTMHYNFAKPPVHGLLFDWIDRHAPGFWTPQRRDEARHTTTRFVRFWLNHRLDAATGLPYYIHGNETADNATFFDGGYPVVTPDLPAYLAMTCRWLGDDAETCGDTSAARRWKTTAQDLVDQMTEHLWDGTRFAALRLADRSRVSSLSLLSVMPLVAAPLLPRAVRDSLATELARFATPVGFASERPDSPDYRDDAYWRGPVWAPNVMLLADALEQLGRKREAAAAAGAFCRACMRSGFAENFDASSGEGYRDRGYTWTASVFLCLSRLSPAVPVPDPSDAQREAP